MALTAVGQIQQGRATAAAAAQQSANIEAQKAEAAQLSSIEEWRTRQKMRAQMREGQATLGARGVDMGSPTAIFLGQQAAREIAFAGAAIRQGASAEQRELTGQQKLLEARGRQAIVTGRYRAAGTVLNAAPDIWPELLS